MARDPGSIWKPLPEAGAPDGYTKTQFIVHSTGDNKTAKATWDYFAGPTLNESTFIVGWGPEDPTLQIMDSTDNADANGSANQRGISVEVVGDGIGGYNAWQRSEIIRLARWSMANHPGILPRVIPSEPAAGLGWHVMFGAPGPWAKVAKSCPGAKRIQELKTDIFPAIFAGQEDDMTPGQALLLEQVHAVLFAGSKETPQKDTVYQRIVELQGVVYKGTTGTPVEDTVFHKLVALLTDAARPAAGAAQLPTEFDLPNFAREIARQAALEVVAEQDRRARDSDPATGPVS